VLCVEAVFRSGAFGLDNLQQRELRMDNDTTAVKPGRVTLKTLSEYLGLTAGTISAVLNQSSGAVRIPQHTRDRIFDAARKFNYQPNPLARALRVGSAVSGTSDQHEIVATHGAVVILGAHQFSLAINAIQQAGLRVHDDFSVLDLSDVSGAWDSPAFESAPHYPSFQPATEPT
jgi:hypothetical protein